MDDMTDFERQLAARLEHKAGPQRPVDAMEIVRTATTSSSRWSFQSMFSATKFVVAGAIVAMFGGFLLIAQPFDQRDGGVPGAAQSDDAMAVAVFTGTEICCGQFGEAGTLSETSEGFRLEVGGWENAVIDATDPRLSGEYIWTWTSLDVEGTKLFAATAEVLNDGGRWIGTTTNAFSDDGTGGNAFPDVWETVLSGMDGYEGLTAYVSFGDNEWYVEGVIFPGDMPSAPEPCVKQTSVDRVPRADSPSC